MGTFLGHFSAGCFLAVFGTWWLFSCLHRYYRGRYCKSPPFRSSVTYPFFFCGKCLSRYQIEGILLILISSGAIAGEVITGTLDGEFKLLENRQHVAIYVFFLILGVIDVLMHHGVPLPKSTDYVFLILCFAVEGFVFTFHLHGRPLLDKALHTIHIYAIWCCVFATFGEMWFRQNIFCALARGFFALLQGTWFLHISFIMYAPLKGMKHWKGDSHNEVMVIVIYFAWHMFFISFALCTVAIIMACIHGRGARLDSHEASNNGFIPLDGKRGDDQIGLMESDDGDEDVELGLSSYETKNSSSPH